MRTWWSIAVLFVACGDVVVRVELPPSDAPLRVILFGDGEGRPDRVWVVDPTTPIPAIPAQPLRETLGLVVLEYADAPRLTPGMYTLATEGQPAERLLRPHGVRRGEVSAAGATTWSPLETIPSALLSLDLRVSCPSDVPSDRDAVLHLPRHCPLPRSTRPEICYGRPVFERTMSGLAAWTSTRAIELIDEGLDVVTEADGTPWLYMMSSRADLPTAERTFPARLRLSSSTRADLSTYETLPIVPGPDALPPSRGFVQGIRVRADGREMFFVGTVPNAGLANIFRAWRPTLDAPWTRERAGYLDLLDLEANQIQLLAPLLLPDDRTLLFRASTLAGHVIQAQRRPSTTAGDPRFEPIPEVVNLDRSEGTLSIVSLGLSCDRRHVLYTRRIADPDDPAPLNERGLIGEARIVEIRQLDPLEFGVPRPVTLGGGSLESITTLGEAPDCSALYVSGSLPMVAPRVPCP